MRDKQLTISISLYNGESTFVELMESIEIGNFAPEELEILIIDDGSSDGSPGLANKYAKLYPKLVTVIKAL